MRLPDRSDFVMLRHGPVDHGRRAAATACVEVRLGLMVGWGWLGFLGDEALLGEPGACDFAFRFAFGGFSPV
jgi:hypothetical protein